MRFKIDIVRITAIGTHKAEMGASKRVGHGTGGDDKGLHHKSPKDKGQNKGDDQRFDGLFKGLDGGFGEGGGWFIRHVFPNRVVILKIFF